MMMLIHRICMALRGLGRLHMVDRVMRLKAEMLLQHKRQNRALSTELALWMQPLAPERLASTYVLS